jgi:ribonucleoside-diphosphate reductase alpha chain
VTELSRFIWETRYRDGSAHPSENSIADTWNRVAGTIAAVETSPTDWKERFLATLRDFRFLPGGRILAGAGTAREVTLFNCFVMGLIDDSIEGIFEALKEGAVTMQHGGGVGYDFSTLRPRGSRARSSGTIASGPVSFMRVWDAMCATILSTGARRGAMMATLRCDHPDIEEFVDAKRAPDALRHFNLSVQVTDAFMAAVERDAEWPLVFGAGPAHDRARVYKTVRARGLWDRICHSAYECAEPGVLFIDRINAANNLGYCEQLSATNPCGEEPLPPYGACNLGSINLAAFVVETFAPGARLDLDAIRDTARVAVRFLDNVIEVSKFPLFRQREQAHRSRRIGLGVTGLADALAMLGLRYDSEPARAAAVQAMQTIRDAAYEASVELARERGAFPAFDAGAYLQRPFIRALPPALQAAIARHGIRNSHLLAIAPAGTISLLADNVSSGIEPIFGVKTLRRVLQADGTYRNFQATDFAYELWRGRQPAQAVLPDYFVDASDVAARDHLLMQAALQPCVDGAISKTINLRRDMPTADLSAVFASAFELRLKGCTVFRAASRPSVITERCDRDPILRAEAT